MLPDGFLIRAGAVVAAAALMASPYLVGLARKYWPTATPRAEKQPDDAYTVIEIARRMQAAGNKKGVALCQQLLDVILSPGA